MNQETTSKYSTTNALFAGLAKNSLRFRWLLLLFVAGITIFAFFEMRNLRFDNSNEVWFVEGDPTVELLDKFRDVFGNDDFVILLFESEDFFEPENIRLLGTLAKALEAEVPYLKDMIWLGNVEYIEGVRDGVNIYELLETIPETPEEMAVVRKKALSESTYIDSLIAPDGQAYTIILEMERYPEDGDTLDPKSEIAPVCSGYPNLGRPITFTTITLILGFLVMILSVMSGWSHFGFLAGFAFLWAYLADFFLCPALILLLKPLGAERQLSDQVVK